MMPTAPVRLAGALTTWPPFGSLQPGRLLAGGAAADTAPRVAVHRTPGGYRPHRQFDQSMQDRVAAGDPSRPPQAMDVVRLPVALALRAALGLDNGGGNGGGNGDDDGGGVRHAIAGVPLADVAPALAGVALPAAASMLDRAQPYFWAGPAGKRVPLHRDGVDGVLGQVWGRKRLSLLAPSDPGAYPLPANPALSTIPDLDDADPTRFPAFDRTRIVVIDLEPGDLVVLPAGWWHQVDYVDAAISVNFWPVGYL